jgi:tetratricopeptide (TPR) repeat protein
MRAVGPLTPVERRDYELGRRCFERGDTETSLPHLTRLIQTRNFADVHYMIGVMYHRKGDLAAAAHSLREALRINPSYSEALLALANVYESQGDFDRSREIAERAGRIADSADDVIDATTRGKLANLQAALGDAYREVGELREAIEAYRKALDRCPDFHDIRHRLGLALREAGLPNRALAEFRRVLRAHPDYHDAAVQAGLTLYTLGRSEDAVREWQAVIRANAEHTEARMYLRMVQPED